MTRDDAISREWLKTAIHNFYHGLNHTPTEEDIQRYIEVAPSVSTEKTGRWRECEDNTSFVRQIPRRWLECSNCGWSCDLGYKSRYKYCPNCGCRMVEQKEGEDKE